MREERGVYFDYFFRLLSMTCSWKTSTKFVFIHYSSVFCRIYMQCSIRFCSIIDSFSQMRAIFINNIIMGIGSIEINFFFKNQEKKLFIIIFFTKQRIFSQQSCMRFRVGTEMMKNPMKIAKAEITNLIKVLLIQVICSDDDFDRTSFIFWKMPLDQSMLLTKQNRLSQKKQLLKE